MALGYISAHTIWNAKPVVTAIKWICWWWQYQWEPLPIVGCMALGYISAQTIWNAKPVVTAIKWICWWRQYQWEPLPIVCCVALGYISAQTIWNAKPIVAAIQWICQWWQYQCDPLPIVGLYGFGTHFTPKNVKHKVHCGSNWINLLAATTSLSLNSWVVLTILLYSILSLYHNPLFVMHLQKLW